MKTVNVYGESLEDSIIHARNLKRDIEDATEKLNLEKAVLREAALAHLSSVDRSIKFVGNSFSATVSFPEPTMKITNIAALKEALGADFEVVVGIEYKVKDPEKLRLIMASASNGFKKRLATALSEHDNTPRVTIE